jgi:hypothetical protein
MAKFKKLTTIDKRSVWINFEKISLIEPFNEREQNAYVRLTYEGGNHISVVDDVQSIIEDE